MSKRFDGLTHMRIEILIDPETMEYQVDLEGTHKVLLAGLLKVVEDLKNPETIDKLTVDPN